MKYEDFMLGTRLARSMRPTDSVIAGSRSFVIP